MLAAAGWLAAAAVAVLIGLGALRLVGESIAGTPGGVLSQEDVGRELARSPGGPAATGPGSPPASGSASSASASPASPGATVSPTGSAPAPRASSPGPRRVFTTRGGNAVAECRGSSVWLVSWAPAPGFWEHEVDRGPGPEAEVDFRGSAGRSRIKVSCPGGQPVAETRED
jgi:hypothetical protein